jgi:hypothetical protein
MKEPDLLSKLVSPVMTALLTFALLAGLAGLAVMAFKFLMNQIGGL